MVVDAVPGGTLYCNDIHSFVGAGKIIDDSEDGEASNDDEHNGDDDEDEDDVGPYMENPPCLEAIDFVRIHFNIVADCAGNAQARR